MTWYRSILTVLMLFFGSSAAFGSYPRSGYPHTEFISVFSGMDFLVGFKGGINFSLVSPTQRFSVIQGTGGGSSSPDIEKNYNLFIENIGYQYGFIGLFRVSKTLSISLEPTFSSYAINYSTENSWYDLANRIEITNQFSKKLKYAEIPLVIRYNIRTGDIKPFISAGLLYGLLTGAPAKAQSSTVQIINGIEIPLEYSESVGDISDNYIRTRLAVFPGAGFIYDLSFISLFAEIDYIIGLHNITDESTRYSNQQSVGSYYDVPDDLRFDNLVINLGILFNISSRQEGSSMECPPIRRKR